MGGLTGGEHSARALAALDRLGRLHPKLIDLSLDRVWQLLADLGNPQDSLPPVVHVAGTNGKGSVVAFLRSMMEAAGYRVHVYTSPHLVRFNERIRLAGADIDDELLADLLEEVEQVNGDRPITFFEVTTCAAFLAFSRVPADLVILETGLGGRLDATNVIKRPAVTVITQIAKDHEQFLGGHIEAIAAEKSHIIKAGVPCVVAKQERKAGQIVELRSLEVGAPTDVEGKDFHVRAAVSGDLTYQGRAVTWHLPPPGLIGAHQLRNAGLALAAAERLSETFDLSESALGLGLKSARWPARMQHLTRGPLVDLLPEGWELWLDGAHNPAAGKMLATFIRGWKDMPLDMVMGMMGPKDADGFFKPLGPRIHRLRTVPVPDAETGSGKAPEDVAEAARRQFVRDAAPAEDVDSALRGLIAQAAEQGDGPRRVLICGSLYLAGSILSANG